jgi:hypothetical protein
MTKNFMPTNWNWQAHASYASQMLHSLFSNHYLKSYALTFPYLNPYLKQDNQDGQIEGTYYYEREAI